MRFILFTFLALIGANSFSQIGTGQWRMHAPSNQAIDIVVGNGEVHTCMPKQLLTYNIASGETTSRDNVNYLSDISLSAIGFNSNNNQLYIGYKSGNIDVLVDETIINLPFIKTAELTGDKSIKDFLAYNGLVYVSTGFGIVVIDPIALEVKDTYYPTAGNEEIVDLEVLNDSLFALSPTKLYKGKASNPFLADPGQWIVDTRVPNYSLDGDFNSISAFNNNLYVSFNHIDFALDSLLNISTGNTVLFDLEINQIDANDTKLFVNTYGGLNIMNNTEVVEEVIFQYTNGLFPQANRSVFTDGNYYIADAANGFVKATNAFSSTFLNTDGPRDTKSYRLDWGDGKVSVVAGGLSGAQQTFSNAGTYNFYDEKWVNINRDNQPIISNAAIWDFLCVDVNPKDHNNVAYGTFSPMGVILTKDGKTISDTLTPNNSLLELTSLGNNAVFVSDLEYDTDGNLWIANGYANRPLKMLTKEGIWYDFELPSSAKNKFTYDLKIDYNGTKWMSVDGLGIVAFNEGNDFDDTSDDKIKLFTSGATSGDLPSVKITALAVDFDNEIWVGSSAGIRVLNNSQAALDATAGNYNFQKLLINFGESTEEVFKNVDVTDIEIDGANRKWIATSGSGLYLFSADGLEVISEFNTENSPLISNNITDITIDQNTGEVFIATDEGLVSYRSDATYGDPKYEDVVVFPNPVLPTHSGIVTIQGIGFNSDVKITDISGNLVYKTTSNGGTATWNGRTLNGERASTGVYLIWTAQNDEKGRKVGKVVFVN